MTWPNDLDQSGATAFSIRQREGPTFGDVQSFVPASAVALFTAATQGIVPASGGGTANYLRADGTWAPPPGGGGGGTPGGSSGQIQYNNAGAFGGFTASGDATINTGTGVVTIANGAVSLVKMANLAANAVIGNNTGASAVPLALTQAQLTAMVNAFTTTLSGAAPASGGGTTNFLRADGTWAAPPSGTPGGASGSVQYNNAGAFGGFGVYTAASHILQLDAADAAAPAAQTLQVQSVVGGTANTAGVDWTHQGSLGTGTGAGGNILFKIAPAGAAGTTQNAAALSLVVGSNVVEHRNGATAQALRVYNTVDAYPTTTNYERGVFDFATNANVLTIGTQAGGTGSFRDIYLGNVQSNFVHYVGTNNFGTFSVGSGAIRIYGGWTFGFTGNLDTRTNGADAGLFRVATNVVGFCSGNANTLTGWMQWTGQTRVTADVTFTSTTALATVTGLSVNVQAGRTYVFEAHLSFTDAAAGGIQAAISGTATATDIRYDGFIVDSAANGIKGNTQAAALGTAVASSTTTGTAGCVIIRGTITVNAAGTLLVQAAQNTSNATATTIKRGSWFYVYDNA